MTHLGERITDYVLGEITGADKAAAEAHLRECAECAQRVKEFQNTYAMLRTTPDVEPPRRIVFETQERAEPWFWRWLAPAASAVAASLLTALFLAPGDSNPVQTPVAKTEQPATSLPPAQGSAQADVQALVRDAVQQAMASERQANSQLLAAELDKRDRGHNLEIQRVRGELAYWESQQRAASRESLDAWTSIQLIAQRLPAGN